LIVSVVRFIARTISSVYAVEAAPSAELADVCLVVQSEEGRG
jgi:hypothetical protein